MGSHQLGINCFDTKELACKNAALKIVNLIRNNNDIGRKTVLGLATGASPVALYKELISFYTEGHISFKNVVTFNLDEYFPMPADSPFSYKKYMQDLFFSHIDIKPENCFVPDGSISPEGVNDYCKWYEENIQENGGIDLQILGIGRTGHIGFNEPGSPVNSKTRLVRLHAFTREDAAPVFGSVEDVPRYAITMGIQSILQAKQIMLLSFGKSKSKIFREVFDGSITSQIPASFLKIHFNVNCYVDSECYRFHTEKMDS